MKAKELRLMNEADLTGKVAELKKELMKMNSQIAAGTVPKHPRKVREMKKSIAKIYTIRTERAMGIHVKKETRPKPQAKPVVKKEAPVKAASKKTETKGGTKKE